MFASTIVIALSTDDENLKPIYDWSKKFDWNSVKAVHFIHVLKIVMTPLEFGFLEVPDDQSFQAMSADLKNFMQKEAQKIIPKDFEGQVFCHLKRSFTPQETIKELIEETHSDILVVGHVQRHGLNQLFHSSFTAHMLRNSPCDVLVVR
jgi:nucleotide-binding universal stress UspA family protein